MTQWHWAILGFLCQIQVAGAADLPDPHLTPGLAANGTVEVMCTTKWGKDERHVTDAMKAKVYAEYGIAVKGHYVFPHVEGKPEYEIDHLISRELLGADDVRNLWPQSYITKPWNAHVKDRLENFLHRQVCAGKISLKQAQDALRLDWTKAYRDYIGAP